MILPPGKNTVPTNDTIPFKIAKENAHLYSVHLLAFSEHPSQNA